MTSKRRSILCVDDEERDLQLQRATFEDAGFHVAVARDLAQVNHALKQHDVEAVVLDYRLLNADPIHVAISVRKQFPRMPIVILSGYVEDIPEYFKRAVDACMTKHEDREHWVNTLYAQLGSQYGAGANGD
ncbi:response regulator receiver protein [Candidatus Koribacter versatilis Ellin345]|uniref:Response regulator receiver protein n=1 Tax=Koribacter versatilis (strain Ellin345) TaxID=204669 RepID=Q1IR98_KORVE|nr:response regulator [Candidatus Koribacter versatilis]ABF40602.1 response regulator receiver protein [Candidatus Koribacter versatilis Ellin345]